MKVSVIIACYNAEKYLAEAIYSAANQTFSASEYEIIAVNDGSADETRSILEAYSAEYPNIRVLNKENGGPSSARNLGLKEAKGEYIYFFDADDIMELDSLECLYNRAKEQDADMVIAKYDIFDKTKKSPVTNISEMVKQDVIDKYDTRILWTFALWNKLFKKSIIDENDISFPPVSNAEDGVFVFKYTFQTKKITGLDKIILHYRKAYNGIADSITTAVSKKSIVGYMTAHEMIYDTIIKSMLRDYPELKSVDNIRSNLKLSLYINEFYKKLVHLAINQFYAKTLLLDDECAGIVIDSIKLYCSKMSPAILSELQDKHPEVPLYTFGDSKKELLSHKYITAVLYGDENDLHFIPCLKSIINQNLIGIKIILNNTAKDIVQNAGLLYENMEFINADSESELFNGALSSADTDIIIFCDSKFIYANNAFRVANRRYMKEKYDFLTGVVYADSCSTSVPIEASRRVVEEYQTGLQTEGILSFDNLLANKFFNVDILKKINADMSSNGIIEQCYNKGYCCKTNNRQLTFAGSQEEFTEYLGSNAKELNKSITSESTAVLMPEKDMDSSIKNQICIIVKKDNLQNNGKALKKKLNSKAKVFEIESRADLSKSSIIKAIENSRVVVTDIILPHLSSYSPKKGQRFIFSFDTENLFDLSALKSEPSLEKYTMITVSSSNIIPICADKLSLDEKVFCATGSIKSDALLSCDSKTIRKNKILKGKEIILYIPGKKKINTKGIDFDSLSSSLKADQIVITADNINKTYSNIISMPKYSVRELMLISDMLICDYSPAVFEYALLNKPMVFYCADMNINNVGYCLHYPEDVPSYLIRTQSELNSFIGNPSAHIVQPDQHSFAKKYMSGCDGKSADRLAGIINDYMEAK